MGRAAAQECPSAFWQHWQAPFFVFNRPPFARKSRSWKKTIASGSRETSLTSSRKTKRTRSCGSPQTKLGTSSSKTFGDRKSTRLNSSHGYISYAVFCLKKKKK